MILKNLQIFIVPPGCIMHMLAADLRAPPTGHLPAASSAIQMYAVRMNAQGHKMRHHYWTLAGLNSGPIQDACTPIDQQLHIVSLSMR